MESPSDRLRNARAMSGYSSAAKAADALGVSASTYRAHENGQNDFGLDEAQRYGRKFRVQPIWLLSGEGDGERHELSQPSTSGDISNLDIRAGMGNGGLLSVMADDDGYKVADEFINGAWSFPDAVKAVWRNMPETYALPVIGDSMAPTIANGSYAFVDLTYRYPAPEDIYAVDYGDGLMVKRVKLIPQSEKVLIMSDNSRYSDDEVRREDLHVYGRVVAWFHWKG